MSSEQNILEADFNPKVCIYWLLSGALVFVITIVGIPLLLLWFSLGFAFTKRYLDRMECVLTDKALKVRKGIFVRVEKTIPLEKITDMGMIQGPIMRSFDLHTLTVETAGQSGVGSLVSLTGIVKAPEFREAVLHQRELQAADKSQVRSLQSVDEQEFSDGNSLLTEIRNSLLRIESVLKQQSER